MMKPPTHETVAQRARILWENAGRPAGRDHAIWHEAEQQLLAEASGTPAAASESPGELTARIKSETAAESVVENHLSPAPSEEEAIRAAVQSESARPPQIARPTGPKAKPPEPGKPFRKPPRTA